MKKLYILDTETTGLNGYPTDKVLELAIISLDVETMTYKIEFNELIGHNTDDWNTQLRECWVFENTDITLDMIKYASPYSVHKLRVSQILTGRYVTSFNRDYDIGKFMSKPPYNFQNDIQYFPCIMLESTGVCKIPGYYGDYKWPSLAEAFEIILNKEANQNHRALDDTIMATKIVSELIRRGHFNYYLDKMK